MTITAPPRFRGIFRQDARARAVYSEAAGIHRITPTAVAVPTDVDDLSALLEWARGEQVALVPRGSGSSMSGGAIGPAVIVDLSRWNHVGEIDVDRRQVTVGPGAICGNVEEAAAGVGLRFPVDPSSAAFCTIGGMTSTNAAGAHSLAFGSTRRWVAGIECVFAEGERSWIRRGAVTRAITPLSTLMDLAADPSMSAAMSSARHIDVRKDSSGYATADFASSGDPVDLLVGSEGTLAFFTSIELKLDQAPGAVASVLGTFSSLTAAAEAAILARESGAVACELLDKTFLDFVGSASGTPIDSRTQAVLLADAEGATPLEARSIVQTIAAAFGQAGATENRVAMSADERKALWTLRHAASPTLARLGARLRSMQFIEDGAVPPQHLADYIAGVRAALDGRGIPGVIFGHAGDAHVHVNPLIDVHDAGWRQKVDGLLDEVTSLVSSLGGTLSGEHGDGRLRTPLLNRVWKPGALRAFEAVKRIFDPSAMLNPGVKTGRTAGPLEIKYDPAAPPLPSSAAAALDEVYRVRSYSRFRLDMIDPES